MTTKDKMMTDVYMLKDIFRSIIPITKSCKIKISENGWNINVIDAKHVASLNLDMDREFISSYDINSTYILDMNIEKTVKMLEDIDNNESAEIILEKIDKDDKQKIIMKFKIGIINHNMIFELKKEDDRKDGLDGFISKDLTEISVNSKDFRTIIKEFYKFSDYILFETRDNRIRASCAFIDNNHDAHAYFGDGVIENIRCLFDLKYLDDFIDAINLTGYWNSSIGLYMGTDLPLRIKFNVGRYGTGVYTLAPRINI